MPKFLESLFWDTPFKGIHKRRHSAYIIKRILEYGDMKSIKWMLGTYGKKEIIGVVKSMRDLSKKSGNFWSIIFNIRREDILCLSGQFQKKHKKIWNY